MAIGEVVYDRVMDEERRQHMEACAQSRCAGGARLEAKGKTKKIVVGGGRRGRRMSGGRR